MEGCSLHDAFPDAGKPARIARREERRRAATCPGPALTFLKAQADVDPDRQQVKLPPAEKVGAGFRETDGFRSSENFHDGDSAQKVDVIGQKVKTGQEARTGQEVKSGQEARSGQAPDYFGKPPVDSYADFSPSPKDNPGYMLGASQADFLASFAAPGLGKAGGVTTLATPNTNNAWKPLTPSGVTTSFVGTEEHSTLVKKLDVLFARLEDLESRENANGHIEITMFILSGLFLLFGIETLRKF